MNVILIPILAHPHIQTNLTDLSTHPFLHLHVEREREGYVCMCVYISIYIYIIYIYIIHTKVYHIGGHILIQISFAQPP